MQQSRLKLTTQAALMASIAAAFPVVAQGTPAARVDFAIGDVAAVNKAGQSRPVAKGAVIEEGETINTNNGRTQLRFTDGAYVSLQPQSEFRIDQYRFEGKQDGSEKTFVSLLKGGLRTITGFVGRTNKKNYQVATTMATIGIRGTEYTIQYGESISGTVGEGEIEVCNGAGCLNVTNGESYYVANQDVKPQLSNKGTDLPPDPPPPPRPQVREGERFGPAGVDCLADPDGCESPFVMPPVLPPVLPLTGPQTLDSRRIDFCDGVCTGGGFGATVVFDDKGKLLDFGGEIPATVQMRGNDGIVAWGTFTDSSSLLTHFVAGLPVPSADLANLGGLTGTYSLISGTPVTDPSNNTIGTLNSATLTVDFGPGTVGVDMNWTNWTISGAPPSATLAGGGTGTSFSASGTCGPSCLVRADILLFGANAVRAGMTYDISIRCIDGIGAAALKQTGLVSTPAAKTTP
ncbi:MAG: FecR family protein [Pseudomonadota bacterium]